MQFVHARSLLTQHWDPEKMSQQMYSFLWPKRWSPSLLPAALCPAFAPSPVLMSWKTSELHFSLKYSEPIVEKIKRANRNFKIVKGKIGNF